MIFCAQCRFLLKKNEAVQGQIGIGRCAIRSSDDFPLRYELDMCGEGKPMKLSCETCAAWSGYNDVTSVGSKCLRHPSKESIWTDPLNWCWKWVS